MTSKLHCVISIIPEVDILPAAFPPMPTRSISPKRDSVFDSKLLSDQAPDLAQLVTERISGSYQIFKLNVTRAPE